MTDLVLGLDSGGTKTDLAVVDRSGAVLVRRQGEGMDPTAGPAWKDRLTGLASGLGPVSTAVLGLPYHDEIAEVTAAQLALARALFGPAAQVLNDVAVAFEGALGGADGVLILAGTGSMAWARGPGGTHRVGGWGAIFGDEGSAYWIGCAALARVSQHLDGRSPDAAFATALLAWLGVAPADLLAWTYQVPNARATVASVAVGVSRLAYHGDPTAISILNQCVDHLAQLGKTAAKVCGAPAPLRWSYAGGVMKDPLVLAKLTTAMGHLPDPPLLSPVGGAVLAAARSAGWPLDPSFIAQLQLSLHDPTTRP